MKQNNGLYMFGGLIVFSELFNVHEARQVPLLMIPSERTYMILENHANAGLDIMGAPVECAKCGYDLGWRINNGMYHVKKDNIS